MMTIIPQPNLFALVDPSCPPLPVWRKKEDMFEKKFLSAAKKLERGDNVFLASYSKAKVVSNGEYSMIVHLGSFFSTVYTTIYHYDYYLKLNRAQAMRTINEKLTCSYGKPQNIMAKLPMEQMVITYSNEVYSY
ncbi:MAG: hypothetical protein R6U95_09705, partial [Bacteroidales bacterium]